MRGIYSITAKDHGQQPVADVLADWLESIMEPFWIKLEGPMSDMMVYEAIYGEGSKKFKVAKKRFDAVGEEIARKIIEGL